MQMENETNTNIFDNCTNRNQHLPGNQSNGNRFVPNISPDKITTMIQSWNVKFDGSSKGIRCEEELI